MKRKYATLECNICNSDAIFEGIYIYEILFTCKETTLLKGDGFGTLLYKTRHRLSTGFA